MSDGYEVYAQVALKHDLVHLGCWAHCRRYFVEALDTLPKRARARLASQRRSSWR